MPFPPELLIPPSDLVASSLDLTSVQLEGISALKSHFGAKGFTLAVAEHDSARAPLSEREMMFLSKETFIRFLTAQATKGDIPATISRLERCIVWRRTAGVEDVETMARSCEDESRTGKNIVQGFSPNGMPVLYFFPSRNRIPVEQRRAVHAIFMLERAIDLMADGVTSVLVVFNFSGKRQGPPTSVSLARETLHRLGEFYPERLGLNLLQDVPLIVRAFISLMWPFVDVHTKKKVKMCQGAQSVADGDIHNEILLTECGGKLDLPYDHDAYWPVFISTCLARRADQLERWRALGEPEVGREERLFKVSTLLSKEDNDNGMADV